MTPAEIPEFFERSPVIPFPYTVPGGEAPVVERLDVVCGRCGEELSGARGSVTDYAECADFMMAAECRSCSCITPAHVRVYSDGRVMHQSKTGWVVYRVKRGWFSVLLQWLGF